MAHELEHAAGRFITFANEVLAPAVRTHKYVDDLATAITAWQSPEAVPFATAVAQQDYQPVAAGWRWGPAWSTCWFRIRTEVPQPRDLLQLALRFSCGTEAMLWDEHGRPIQGFDRNRDLCVLPESLTQGQDRVTMYVEAACNHPFGTASFSWDDSERAARWREQLPGRLEPCYLVAFNPTAWRLHHTFEFARQMMQTLPLDSPRAHELKHALDRVIRAIDPAGIINTAPIALSILDKALSGDGGTSGSQAIAVGHAHIDTAWLWPICETKRKCIRSFTNVIGLMKQFPDFHFMCSQAQQYEWVRQDCPALFDEITTAVEDGRWEPGGAMWVEPDCNVPSGESLVRQILYGTHYWLETFGEERGEQRHLFLPDTFGFPASLPQIMAHAGLDTFITNKLWWNQHNEFPFVNFRWRGIDGTEVLAHLTPGRDYNATNSPAELARGVEYASRKCKPEYNVWLQPFGYGDGGGGPTDWIVLNAELSNQTQGLPSVTQSSVSDFCDQLHQRRAAIVNTSDRPDLDDLPVWDGELYLELHRGTLTTQAWLKQANRAAERDLRTAEWLMTTAPDGRPISGAARERLHGVWKTLLLNQFHDILPGSSITWVYDDSRADHSAVATGTSEVIAAGLERWVSACDATGMQQPLVVFNPCSHIRGGFVVHPETKMPAYVPEVPALGVCVVDVAAQPPQTDLLPVTIADNVIENGILRAVIDEAGRIASLCRLDHGRDAVCDPAHSLQPQRGPLNRLMLYDDLPRAWEAWDIDPEYTHRGRCINDTPADRWEVAEQSPARVAIRTRRAFGQGSIVVQRIVLEAGSPRLDIHTYIDWTEDRKLLRALFPVDVRSPHVTCDIQFGHVLRPTTANTSWDSARFEFCAHRWMDLSEPGFGVALLNDCKYGHSCRENVMGLSLLRAPRFPDESADFGHHVFSYSLMPHDGDWRAAGVDCAADELNTPLITRELQQEQAGAIRDAWAPFEITHADDGGPCRVAVSAVKPLHVQEGAGPSFVLRLVETGGADGRVVIHWNVPVGMCGPLICWSVRVGRYVGRPRCRRMMAGRRLQFGSLRL